MLVLEAEASLVGLGDLVEAVEVELPDKRFEAAVPEVARKHILHEQLLVFNYDFGVFPVDDLFERGVLRYSRPTCNNEFSLAMKPATCR
jgi:hypothetical protein